MAVEFDVQNIDEVYKIEALLNEVLEEVADEGVIITDQNLKNTMVQRNLIASRDLFTSFTTTFKATSSVEYFINASSDDPAADILNSSGRHLGSAMPPIAAIVRWMSYKGLEPSISGAYLIARKISERGIAPNFFINDSIEKSRQDILALIFRKLEEKLK